MRIMRSILFFVFVGLISAALVAGCGKPTTHETTLRVGYYPNLTHAQALVGLANGTFEQALGPGTPIRPKVFNAGPSVIEALFADELDLAYVGPNPAINGYVKSRGQALRVIAGAASGGAVLVVRDGVSIQTAKDFAGKRVATPQLGNTQDVAMRHYLLQRGLSTEERGGTVRLIPMQNPDILTAFLKGAVDAAWVPEPWGARLVREAGGKIFLDERQLWPEGKFSTAVVIVSAKTLDERPEVIRRWLQAHVEVTEWIDSHPDEAKRLVNAEIAKLTGKKLSDDILNDAWSRLHVTYDPLAQSLVTAGDHAFELGFLGVTKPELALMFDLHLLNDVLRTKRRAPVATP